jgi:hypothetical protein
VSEYKFYTAFLLILIIGLILLSQVFSKNAIVTYGEKMEKKKYNNDNFKVYNDYLIRDPSEYGIKDIYNNPTPFDNQGNGEDRALKSIQIDEK